MIRVIFVCLGNICRSPMAEAIFQNIVTQEGLNDQFHIDSAGTGDYHVGEPAHRGTRQVLAAHGITYQGLGRQVTAADLVEADYLIAMDHDNLTHLKTMTTHNALKGRLSLLLNFAPDQPVRNVPDPYYSGNFEEVYHLIEAGCQGLLAHIRQEQGL